MTTTVAGEDLRKCLICQQQIRPVWDEIYDLKYHYTMCYIKAGKFSEFLARKSGTGSITDFKQRDYHCPDLCEKRSMIAVEFLLHMGIVHEVTRELMAENTRLQSVLTKCFPRPPKSHLTTLKTFKKTQEQHQLNLRVNPIVEDKAAGLDENPNEEEVDDPGMEPVSQTQPQPQPAVRKIKQENHYFESKPAINIKPISTRINKIHQCLLCEKKDGKTLNLSAEGMHDVLHHYANCYYDKHGYKNIIDPGPDNKDDRGNPLEVFGSKFKYRCPFPNCENTNSKRPASLMGFKWYAIHCAANHGQLEVAMAQDTVTKGVEEVRLALLRHKEIKGEIVGEMPEVIVEEFHTCVVCEGESGKDAKNLSLDPSKLKSLKYHYANCYFDYNIEVYLNNPERYTLEPENTDEKTGKPLDYLGREYKYTCHETVCTKLGKNNKKLGYKSFCQHVAIDHGGLREIMQEDSRPGIKYILEKLGNKI